MLLQDLLKNLLACKPGPGLQSNEQNKTEQLPNKEGERLL